MIKKFGVLVIAVFSLLLALSIVSAALEVKSEPISSTCIPELNKPAIFSLNIKNLGESDNFLVYSLAGVNIVPNTTTTIASGESKTIDMNVYPNFNLKVSPDYYSFEYKIKGDNSGTLLEEAVITLFALKDAFDATFDDVNPDSKTAVLHFKNKYGGSIDNIVLELNSPLFSVTKEISLNAFEDKAIDVELDSDKVKYLMAGEYLVEVKINVNGVNAIKSSVIDFKEKEGISTTESLEGSILRRYEIEKKNIGNVPAEVTIVVVKDLFSALFTNFNILPTKKEIQGFKISYVFKKQLSPNESLRVIAKTNWWILVGIIILIGIIWYLVDKYVSNKIKLRKTVSLVRTKGGEFALKVSITVKARDYAERIRVLDRLPPMVKVFERYGIAMPEKIDVANRRLEWNIQSLSSGEERVLSYIIYSKIGVMGRFELPAAEAIYEYQGKLKEAQSNRAFYLNESGMR